MQKQFHCEKRGERKFTQQTAKNEEQGEQSELIKKGYGNNNEI
jgi:hypothetical protein